MLLSFSNILLDLIKDFPVTIQKYVQMVFFFFRLDDMHASLPDLKYSPPFLHGVFLFSKVGVLAVNFDGFFALAYSSHLL